MRRIIFVGFGTVLLCFSSLAGKTPAGHSSEVRLVEILSQLPLSFEPNVGQLGIEAGQEVKFISRAPGYTVFLTGNAAVLVFERGKAGRPTLRFPSTPLESRFLDPGAKTLEAIRLEFLNAEPNPRVEGLEELASKNNYFFGDDPEKWRTDVPVYARVRAGNLYPGIDLIYHGNHRRLEFDLVVAAGADPHAIRLKIETEKSKVERRKSKVSVDAGGDLVIATEGGEVRFHKPAVYQSKDSYNSPFTIHNSELLTGRYVLSADNQIQFEIPSYDKGKALVIDPVLAYASYLGGGASDLASGVAVDSSGNVYVTGYTLSTKFPTTSGVFQTSNAGGSTYGDVFVTKLNATGSAVVYSTYLGGSNDDVGVGLAVDSSGNAYVAGYTRSGNFPTTSGAFRKTLGGGTCGQSPSTFPCGDAFVTKLNASGNGLLYSTYLGGGLDDWALGIAVDGSGNAYVTGYAESTDFPATTGAYQSTFAGGTCGGGPCATVFVSKLAAAGSGLAYSTYLGGNGGRGYGIAVDSSGNSYVVGSTDSTAFPTTSGAFETASAGNGDAFAAKLNASGSALAYSTYLGGGGGDVATGVALDSSGNAYIAGLTSSSNFPVTSGVLQSTCGGCQNGFHDAFVTKLNPSADGLIYSTYLGGSGEDLAYGIAVDSSGNAYVTGRTLSTDFPTAIPFQPACGNGCGNGLSDVFLAELNASGSALAYSTYFGGSGNDSAYAIALDSSGNAYIAGSTTSTDLVTSSDAFSRSLAGGFDAFVAKVSPANAPAVSLSALTLTFSSIKVGLSSPAQAVTLRNTGVAALSITGITTSGDFSQTNTCGSSVAAGSSCTISVTFSPTAIGTRTGSVTITDNAASSPQAISLTGTGIDQPVVSLSTTQIAFGSQLVGTTSAAQTVTLANTGTSALTISSIAMNGDFAETNTCGSSVAAGASCAFSVTFAPTTTGTRTGTLSVTDDAGGSPQTVSLSGTGVAPAVSLSPSSLSFGNQLVGTTSAAQTLTLTNTGTASLNIGGIAASGDFAETNTCGSSVAAGASCTISVTFTPTATGSRTGFVTITDNASGSPQVVSLSGTGTAPAVTLSAASLTFGNQLVGTTSGAQLVTLTNSGNATLTISGLTANGDFAQANNCGTSLAPGSNCAISVTFNPTATGSRTGSVTITDNASGSPQVIGLSGTGTAPAVTLSPASLSFGNQGVGTSSLVSTLTLSNSGTANLAIASVAIAGDFTQSNTCGPSLAPGASCAFSVTFKPAALGARSGTLTVTDNASGSPQNIALSGTGVLAFGLSSNAGSVRVIKGVDSAQFTISATSSFGFTGSIALTCTADAPASCAFDHGAISPGQSATLTVSNLKGAAGNSLGVAVTGSSGPQTASLSLNIFLADYSLTVSPTESTVASGQAASFEVTIAPLAGFDRIVTLACGQMPPASNCGLSASTVSLDGSNSGKVTVTVTTTATGNGGSRPGDPPPWLVVIFLVFALAWGFWRGFASSVGRVPAWPRRAFVFNLGAALLLSLAAFATACGGGGSGIASAPSRPAGTPAGTYSVTITGAFTDPSTSSPVTLTHSVAASLIVK